MTFITPSKLGNGFSSTRSIDQNLRIWYDIRPFSSFSLLSLSLFSVYIFPSPLFMQIHLTPFLFFIKIFRFWSILPTIYRIEDLGSPEKAKINHGFASSWAQFWFQTQFRPQNDHRFLQGGLHDRECAREGRQAQRFRQKFGGGNEEDRCLQAGASSVYDSVERWCVLLLLIFFVFFLEFV